MKSTTVARCSLAVFALVAFTTRERPSSPPPVGEPSSFLAELHGDLHGSPRGEARFGLIAGRDGHPSVFTLSLGGDEAKGAVLFTRTHGGRIFPGTYAVGGRDDGSDEIRALVMTGTATRPTGVFRGHAGYLIITSVTDNVIRGRFEVDATGFLATDPEDESRPMRATGMFTATRQ
ncbi:MAG TPA: hypothetical protein VFY42_03305 [Gemmatimonadales bacterium]|nr:hypothetical protein [Gemmatimonadales bacterium]